MIASLAMYDRAEVQPANDRLWAQIRDGVRSAGKAAPDALTRGENAYWPAWTAPDLILSQTCGFPYRARLHDAVTLIGTPDYGVEGCAPGYYRSVFVARRDDRRSEITAFDGAALAFNEDMSQSGWAAPQNYAATHGLTLRPHLRSGGHINSARAVAEGRAEIAALDAVTWAMIQRYDSFATALKVVGQTDPTPGLPYISANGADSALLFQIVSDAVANLPAQDRQALCVRGFVQLAPQAYLDVPTPPTPADLEMPAES